MLPFSKCPMCGGEVVERMVQRTIEKRLQGRSAEVTLEMEAEVCLSCGEKFYSPEAVRLFEQIRLIME